jgi:hypothetical protein
MPASKADQVEKAKRIQAVVKSLLDGKSVQEVVVALQSQYKLAESTAYEYTKEATARIHQKIDGELSERISKHYQRLERLYAKSIDIGDIRTARMVLKDIADLLGLDAPKRQDVKLNAEIRNPAKNLTDDELDAKIREYITRNPAA